MAAVAPYATTTATGKYGTESASFNVYGVTPDEYKIQNMQLTLGRFIASSDVRNNSRVCVVPEKTAVDLIGIAGQVEKCLQTVNKPITVAVMGCIVNGPGEAKEADIGLAGGKGKVALFRKGEVLRTVDESMAV